MGRVFLMLNEWKGSVTQQNVDASVNVWGFVPNVSEIQVREGTVTTPGRVLWTSTVGILVRDSTWNNGRELFGGPATWSDFWDRLNTGQAFFEVHSSNGTTVSAALRQVSSSPFSPSCT
jgi:hypothetical protein